MLLLILLVLTGVSNFSDCAIVNSVNTKTTGMNGVTLKFVGYQVSLFQYMLFLNVDSFFSFCSIKIPPFLAATKEPDGNLTFVGTNILLVDWLSKKLNFTWVSHAFLINFRVYNGGWDCVKRASKNLHILAVKRDLSSFIRFWFWTSYPRFLLTL